MMKKRILASSMASVMALSSVSVVAFADEAKKDYGEAVTKDELQAYVDSLENFIENDLDAYGEVQGEDFTKAVNHVTTVLEDSRAVATDYVAAYQMLKSVKDNLRIYTADELKALVKSNTGVYNSENVLNKEFGDAIYTDETYQEFVDAYVDADGSIDSEDDRIITDAYLTLFRAEEKLEKLGTVTKSEFRKALQAYEALEVKMADYELTRRGSAKVKPSTKSDDAGDITKAAGYMEFGTLIDLVYGDFGSASAENAIPYWDGKAWSTVTNVKDGDKYFYIGKNVDYTTGDRALYDAITNLYKELDGVKGVVETSDKKFINAYKTAVDAVNVFNGWEVDDKKSYSKTSTASLERDYHSQLVELFNQTDVKNVIAQLEAKFPDGDDADTLADNTGVEDFDKHTLKAKKTFGIIVVKDTNRIPAGADMSKFIFADKTAAESGIAAAATALGLTAEELTPLSVSSSKNIYDYLTADSAVVGAATIANLQTAATTLAEDFADDNSVTATGSLAFGTINYAKSGDAATADLVKAYNAVVDKAKALYNAAGKIGDTAIADLAVALADYETYKSLNFTDSATRDSAKTEAEGIMERLTEGGPQIQDFTGSGKEWTLIGRCLSYALEDTFPVAKKTDKTLEKLMKLIEDSYESTELTGDSAAFESFHNKVVDTRQDAYEFYKEAKALGKNYDESDIVGTKTLDDVYKKLNDAVSNLKKALAEFEVSYDEIRDAIGKYATAVDKGEVKGDALVKAIKACAYDLSVLEASVLYEGDTDTTNYAFDEDGYFQPANRLKTKKNDKATDVDPNKMEKNLKASYEAMVKAYTDATTPAAGVANDFNGDGAFTTSDLQAILDAFTASSTDTKFDANKDGAFTTSDLKFALDAFTAQA